MQAPSPPDIKPPCGDAEGPRVLLLLVDYCSDDAVATHPEIAPLLAQGWCLRSAEPRLVEGAGTRLLVSLTRPAVPAPDDALAG